MCERIAITLWNCDCVMMLNLIYFILCVISDAHSWSVYFSPPLSRSKRSRSFLSRFEVGWSCFPVTGLTVCDTNWRRQTTWSKTMRLTNTIQSYDWGRAKRPAPCDQFPSANFSPQRKIFSTYHCLQEVCCFWTIRDFAISSNRMWKLPRA